LCSEKLGALDRDGFPKTVAGDQGTVRVWVPRYGERCHYCGKAETP
jgi:hypothetical protein